MNTDKDFSTLTNMLKTWNPTIVKSKNHNTYMVQMQNYVKLNKIGEGEEILEAIKKYGYLELIVSDDFKAPPYQFRFTEYENSEKTFENQFFGEYWKDAGGGFLNRRVVFSREGYKNLRTGGFFVRTKHLGIWNYVITESYPFDTYCLSTLVDDEVGHKAKIFTLDEAESFCQKEINTVYNFHSNLKQVYNQIKEEKEIMSERKYLIYTEADKRFTPVWEIISADKNVEQTPFEGSWYNLPPRRGIISSPC